MLWIHGGPFSSFNAWSWRWNPWVAVAHGWAVLLPDPALSTGYGQGFIARAWPHRAGRGLGRPARRCSTASLERSDVDGDADRLPGRVVRRLHDQLGRRAHRPVRRDRHPRRRCGRSTSSTTPTDVAHNWTGSFGRPADHPDWYARELAAPLRRPDPHADARHPRQPRLPGAGRARRCGCGGTWSAAGTATRPSCRTGSCNSPARTTGSSSPANAEIWYDDGARLLRAARARPPVVGARPALAPTAPPPARRRPGPDPADGPPPARPRPAGGTSRRPNIPSSAAKPSTLRGAYGGPPQSTVDGRVRLVLPRVRVRRAAAVCRSCTSSAAISVLAVAGSNTSTPNRCAPAKAAASARFFTTDRVRVGGATLKDTVRPGVPGDRGPPPLQPLGQRVVRPLLRDQAVVDAGVRARLVRRRSSRPRRERPQRPAGSFAVPDRRRTRRSTARPPRRARRTCRSAWPGTPAPGRARAAAAAGSARRRPPRPARCGRRRRTT